MMNKLILAAATSLLAANLALAQTAAPAATEKKPAAAAPAAEKKTTAAAPAAGKKAPSEKQLKQQERMKACNKDAGDKKLKGADRKKFMSECLKADQPAEAKPAEAAKPAAAAPAKPAEKK